MIRTSWWGTITLLDMLKETDWLVDFTSQFTSVATREHIPRAHLQRRLLLVLFALGTNLGIRAVVNGGDHGESEAALRRIRRMFLTRDNLRAAIALVVSETFARRDEAAVEWQAPPLLPSPKGHHRDDFVIDILSHGPETDPQALVHTSEGIHP